MTALKLNIILCHAIVLHADTATHSLHMARRGGTVEHVSQHPSGVFFPSRFSSNPGAAHATKLVALQ